MAYRVEKPPSNDLSDCSDQGYTFGVSNGVPYARYRRGNRVFNIRPRPLFRVRTQENTVVDFDEERFRGLSPVVDRGFQSGQYSHRQTQDFPWLKHHIAQWIESYVQERHVEVTCNTDLIEILNLLEVCEWFELDDLIDDVIEMVADECEAGFAGSFIDSFNAAVILAPYALGGASKQAHDRLVNQSISETTIDSCRRRIQTFEQGSSVLAGNFDQYNQATARQILAGIVARDSDYGSRRFGAPPQPQSAWSTWLSPPPPPQRAAPSPWVSNPSGHAGSTWNYGGRFHPSPGWNTGFARNTGPILVRLNFPTGHFR
ncbi:hypothetical protein TWF481_003159 [Arthrobotrys musiformis]|uniref:Uncharacterized protein n=1 Tax=Arthrobotrys musiformis TaxID=47236 RepID=A0AAV9VRE5_9PEZI